MSLNRRIVFFLIGCLFFFLFGVFTYVVKEDKLINFDFDTTVKLQNHIPRRFDDFFSYFSVLGSVEVTSVFLLIMLIIRRKIDGIFIVSGFAVFLLFEIFGKALIDHPGPPFLFARYKSLVDFPTNYIPHPSSAYPSGHSGRTMYLSIILIFFLLTSKKPFTPTKLAIIGLIILYDIIMLISRVYLGEHWTTDVVGGALLAISLAFFTMTVLNFKRRPHREAV